MKNGVVKASFSLLIKTLPVLFNPIVWLFSTPPSTPPPLPLQYRPLHLPIISIVSLHKVIQFEAQIKVDRCSGYCRVTVTEVSLVLVETAQIFDKEPFL